MENAIEVRNLCKRYPGFALEDVNFTLPSGCVLGLVGEYVGRIFMCVNASPQYVERQVVKKGKEE